MAGAADIDDLAVAKRVQRVMDYLGCSTHREFADELGVKMHRVNNVLRGEPLSRDLAFRIVRLVPGLTLDWLWFDKVSGMPLRLAKELAREELAPPPERRSTTLSHRGMPSGVPARHK